MPGRFSIPPGATRLFAAAVGELLQPRGDARTADGQHRHRGRGAAGGGPSGDFGGAVGNLRVAAKLDTMPSRVGDPMRAHGSRVGHGQREALPAAAGRRAVGDAREWRRARPGRHDAHAVSPATKEFDWVLTPTCRRRIGPAADSLHATSIPTRGVTKSRRPIPRTCTIAPGTLASADTARTETLLALPPALSRAVGHSRCTSIRSSGRFSRSCRFPRYRFARATVSGARACGRPRASSGRSCSKATAHAHAIHAKFGTRTPRRSPNDSRSGRRTSRAPAHLRERCAGAACRPTWRTKRSALLRQLDEAAFSLGRHVVARSARPRRQRSVASIDSEALPRTQILAPALCIVGLLAIGVASAHAYDASAAQRAFDDGVAAYQASRLRRGARAFIASAAADPRAPDAWANLGTASWAVGGHRAQRRRLAARTSTRAARVRRARPRRARARLPWTSAGYVPPLSAALVFEIAALLWCLVGRSAPTAPRAMHPTCE